MVLRLALAAILKEKQKKVGIFREQYELSFNAHLNLVTIHPWVDGNGRTARLLMNYMAGQLKKSLSLEIESFKASQKKGVGFMF